uniref:Putative m13 family peptidase n=3 Tax=Ixodes ricinus TaxID=34613 RepID=A0A147BP46_IXORI
MSDKDISKLKSFSPPSSKTMTERELMSNPMFLVCSVLCVSAFIIVIIVILGALRGHRRKTEYCETEDCRIHAVILKEAMNPAVNPCENFYKFVCGSWKSLRAIETTSTADDVTLRVYASVIQTLLREDPQPNLPKKLFRTCNAPTSSYRKDVAIFKELKEDIGILWPEKRQTFVHPLDLLLKLSIRWNFNFLLNVRVIPASRRRNRTLLFSEGTIAASFQKPLVNNFSITAYQRYVQEHYRILGASPDTNLRELMAAERGILAAALYVRQGVPEQLAVPLQSMQNFTPTVEPKQWLQFLNNHSEPEPPFTLEQIVILEDARLLRKIGELLKNHPAEQLVIGIAWIFIQSFLWAVSSSPTIRFGKADVVKRYRPVVCLEYMNAALGLLGATEYLQAKFSRTAQLNVDDMVRNLTRSAMSKIHSSPWIDNKIKILALDKLEDMHLDVWPIDDDFGGETSSLLYSRLGNMTDSFTENLATVTENMRALIKLEPIKAIHSKQIAPPSGFLSYLYHLNQISVAPGGVDAPRFYVNGTLAMTYGGIGISLARQVVKAFDPLGITIDDRSNAVKWVDSAILSTYAARANCNMTGESVFPSVVALEVSYSALKQAVEDQHVPFADFRLRGLKEFTENQIFFITHCNGLCSLSREDSENECNAPLKQFPPFTEAFKCAVGTPMNPLSKCVFFNNSPA